MSHLRRRTVLLPLATAVLLGGCGENPDPAVDADGGQRTPAFVVPGADDPPPSDAEAPDDRRPAGEIVDDLLDRAHGPRRGGFDRVAVELRDPAADPQARPVFEIHAALPDRFRVRSAAGWVVGAGGDGDEWMVEEGAGRARAPDQAHAQRTRQLVRLVEALALWPLEHAERIDRSADRRRITLGVGSRSWALRWDPTRRAPVALVGTGSDAALPVVFETFYRTERTLIPTRVRHGDRSWLVRILDTDIDYVPGFFTSPFASGDGTATGQSTMTLGGPGGAVGDAGAPQLRTLEAVRWLVHPDPGDWEGRMKLYGAAGRRLGPAGYTNGGDPMLVEAADGSRSFVVPFRAAREDAEPVEGSEMVEVRELAPHRVLEVLAPSGPDLEARIATARGVLDAALARQGMAPTGPLRVAINLVNRDPAADPGSLHDALVTVGYPVAE